MQRFWEKVRKTDGCWEWTGSYRGNGYAALNLFNRSVSAHRLAYELLVGKIPQGKHVLHKCDNPACVNPDHLFIGTHADNMADKKEKGRAPSMPGEENPAAILTKEQAMEVKRRAKNGERQIDIAAEFGISQPTVSAIKLGRIW